VLSAAGFDFPTLAMVLPKKLLEFRLGKYAVRQLADGTQPVLAQTCICQKPRRAAARRPF
jgi:hypothetical protein